MKNKQEIYSTMRNMRNLKLRKFFTCLQGLNNILPQIPDLNDFKKLPQEDIKRTLFHAIPHIWSKQDVMLGFDFKR